MDSFIVYIIIGVIWVFQLIAKKKKMAERGQMPKRREPERDIFEEFKNLMEKGRQADNESYPEPPDFFEQAEQKIELQKAGPVAKKQLDETGIIEAEVTSAPESEEPAQTQPLSKEFLLKKLFDKRKPKAVESSPVFYLSDLSADVLEQGIILSTIIGPPKSVQMMRRIGARNINSDNY